MPKILLTNHYEGAVLEILHDALPSGFELEILPRAAREELLLAAADADYFIASGRLKIDEEVLCAAKKLKMIARTGVGLDSFDFEALKKHDIPLYVNAGVNSQSVAEHALMLMLAVSKRLVENDAKLKSGRWEKQASGIRCREIGGRTIGIIGMGSIGRIVTKMLSGFGAKVYYYDAFRASAEAEKELNITYTPLEELFEMADIISLHCPLTDDTRHIINAASLAKMQKGVIIINTARGALIDTAALCDAIKMGIVGGAGLDTFEEEPLSAQSELLKLENVITTPHIGGVTYDAFSRMMRCAMENIELFDKGNLNVIESKRVKP